MRMSSSLIDIETIEENGSAKSREKIGRLALSLLLEKSQDKSFDNIYLAFQALARMGLQKAFVSNVENNLASTCSVWKKRTKKSI